MKLILILAFTQISLNGYCDTLDFWHVYVNDKLIAEFNDLSKDLEISLKKNDIKNTDLITVRYGNDHPCFDCTYGLFAFAEIMQKLPEVQTSDHFSKLSIPLKKLLEIRKREGINSFRFIYYEKSKEGKTNYERFLFRLTIKEE